MTTMFEYTERLAEFIRDHGFDAEPGEGVICAVTSGFQEIDGHRVQCLFEDFIPANLQDVRDWLGY